MSSAAMCQAQHMKMQPWQTRPTYAVLSGSIAADLRRTGSVRTIMRKEGAGHQGMQKDALSIC